MLTQQQIESTRDEISRVQYVYKENLPFLEKSRVIMERAGDIYMMFSTGDITQQQDTDLKVELLSLMDELSSNKSSVQKCIDSEEKLKALSASLAGSMSEIILESRSITVAEEFLSRLVTDKECKVYTVGLEVAKHVLVALQMQDRGTMFDLGDIDI